jgi:HSP20 family protein
MVKKKATKTPAKAKEPAKPPAPAATRAISPFDDVERFMDRLFEGFASRGWLRPFHWDRPLWRGDLGPAFEGRIPSVDVVDRDSEIVLRAELPGVDKKDLDVSLSESTVTIKATTRKELKQEKDDYYRSEISQGAFSRTVSLPCPVIGDKVQAKFENGLLEVTLPKAEGAKRRNVQVK